jgi:serine/threonine protein kinase
MHAQAASDPELRERFAREAVFMARIDHPNLARVADVANDVRLLAHFGTRGAFTQDLLGAAEGKSRTIDAWYSAAELERPQVVRIHGRDVEVERAR